MINHLNSTNNPDQTGPACHMQDRDDRTNQQLTTAEHLAQARVQFPPLDDGILLGEDVREPSGGIKIILHE